MLTHCAGDGDKQARSPGRARRKPLKPLRGECRTFFGVTVVTNLRVFYFYTQGCGRIERPAFPAPSDGRGQTISGKLGRAASRDAKACLYQPVVPANAGTRNQRPLLLRDSRLPASSNTRDTAYGSLRSQGRQRSCCLTRKIR